MPDSFFTSTKSRKRKRSESSTKPGGARPYASKSKTSGKPSSSRVNGKASGARQKKGKSRKEADEELSDGTGDEGGIEDLDLRGHDAEASGSGEEDENETPAEKRLRLAKLYLESVKKDLVTAEGEFDAAELDKEIVNTRLKQDVLEHAGKVHLFVSDLYDFTRLPRAILRTRGHRFSVTSAVAASSGKYLFTSGKEGSIIKWDLWTGKKMTTFHKVRPDVKGKSKAPSDGGEPGEPRGHTDEVLALAVSEDGKHLVSAGRDRRLVVWDVEKGGWIKTFGTYLGHRDAISALAFRKGTHELYTASFDRTVKVYDLSPSVLGYVETLYGHQDRILALDALRGQTCVTVGGRDKTARYWKVVEESQLVFRGGGRSRLREVLEGGLKADEEEGSGDDGMDEDGEDGANGSVRKRRKQETVKKFIEGSLECVSMIDENTFVTGGDSGSICLWTTQKKKPIFTQPVAHGFHETTSETEGLIRNPRWITSLASLRYSDVFASGSWDGDVRIWKLDSKLKSFSFAGTIPAPGIVNSLQLVSPPKEFVEGAGWASGPAPDSSVGLPDGRTPGPAERKALGTLRPLLLVAGLGQEHRLGRWLTLKEGVVNGALVVAIPPRTFSS